MKILLDQGTPAPLRRATDQNLRYQQNLTGRRLAILVLPTTSWPKIRAHAVELVVAVNELQPGEFRELIFS